MVLWIEVLGGSLKSFIGCVSRPANALIRVAASSGGATSSCHMFFPISQISSQESDAISSPCVRHSQETFQANNVTPSRKRTYDPGSSLASLGKLLSIVRGRGW